ncbi:sulfatase-like hydrolase/transferase [Halorubrum sp. GN11GM_10-3_MGM]|uniref:sulfatase-like hydrolase/transferase n=1 Tax=Halorubrum sp. GN11GM_10-3_MGM TaxID=2518111 RepID=UPI0010F50416|nr:sulfatase-like hydrolase/transferase [Halorubrum sp. GN11GM_10-3_MGM]TKX67641.1 hypothetical protein EXE40_14660 [Halorubrum sp. GN11GM_10-3_MGM]
MSENNFDGNIFLLTADSLQWKAFNNRLDEIASLTNGTIFEESVSTAPFTVSAMPSLAAGVYGDTVGIGLPEASKPTTLAEALSRAEFTNILISDNYLFGAEYNYQRGFDMGDLGEPTTKKKIANILQNSPVPGVFEVSEWIYFNIIKRMGANNETFYRSASTLHETAKGYLSDIPQEDNVFCWIHYMDTHHPFEPPQEYLDSRTLNQSKSRSDWASYTRDAIQNGGQNLSESEIADIREVYDACCEYLFDELRNFITYLIDSGRYSPDEDLLVFTADHGESLSPVEHGIMGHTPAMYWEDVVRVPLLVSHPEWDSTRTDGQVSLIDLMPTILDLVGAPVPDSVEGTAAKAPSDLVRDHAFFTGIDPIGPIKSAESVAVSRGIRTNSGKKVFGDYERVSGSPVVSTEFDETEETVLFTGDEGGLIADSETAGEMLKELKEMRGNPTENIDVADLMSDSAAQEEIQEHLEDLGYLE